MTKEILAMETGEKLDALVLKEVMGEEGQFYWRGHPDYGAAPIKYSEDISAAWQVLVKAGLAIFRLNNGDWACCRSNYIYHIQITQDHYADPNLVICKTAPEAICKAALLTKLEAGNRSE